MCVADVGGCAQRHHGQQRVNIASNTHSVVFSVPVVQGQEGLRARLWGHAALYTWALCQQQIRSGQWLGCAMGPFQPKSGVGTM